MSVRTGLSRLDSGRVRLPGHRIGLVCNQATIDDNAVHILDALLPSHREGRFEIAAVFGPQHGIWGHTQDNMIEWEGYRDARTGIPFHSLYGEHREPTDAMLEGIDLLVVDLPDIGTRYYTFLWTLALCMKACERLGIPVLVLDRPNPIGGHIVDGTVLDPAFASFVGL
ncbi:MAG: exo-beta-N-acetylmuramidase NamZ domain-containing protein, partial [Fimbriimonadaceae bacterium]